MPQKRSYVHVSGVTPACSPVANSGSVGEGYTRGGAVGGYPGGVYYPATLLDLRLVLPGPNQCQTPLSASTQALQGPSWAPPHTWAPRTQIPAWDPIRARFMVINPKVSQ